MNENKPASAPPQTFNGPPADAEGGLRAPPGLSFWGKAWWWFDFLILVKLARLRFIAILFAIGLVIVKWDSLTAHYERWTRAAAHVHAGAADIEYFCPMHPTVIRDTPKEKCPICFMPLSRRKKGEGETEALAPGIANRVQLSPYRVVLAGIHTTKVEYLPLTKEITTVGILDFNERETKQITAWVGGRLDKLFVNETGGMVSKGDPLASIYSRDLLVTVELLIQAKKSGNTSLVEANRQRLRLWGISDDQIAEFEKTEKANSHLIIRSPIDGHVIKKYVKEGQSVEEGSPMYDVVDLSTVWIQAQVYEEDMAFLPVYHRPLTKTEAAKFGLPVTAITRAAPGQVFTGNLTFVLPHADQDSRSVVARFEIDNADHKLRPGTTATVKLQASPRQLSVLSQGIAREWARESAALGALQVLTGRHVPLPGLSLPAPLHAAQRHALLNNELVLSVPETAVIDTGTQKIVYREVSPNTFEGVLVELGPRMVGKMHGAEGVFYPVLYGLYAGDAVVTSGSFLVDAETRLNPAAGSIYFGGSGGGSKTGQGTTVRPTTPEIKDTKANQNGG